MAAEEIKISGEEKKDGQNLLVLPVRDQQLFVNEYEALCIIESLSAQLLLIKCQM
jgi:hypothetical protein